MREQEETLVWNGQPSADVELWLGRAFNSWLPSKQRIEIKVGRGFVLARPGDTIVKDKYGECHVVNV